MFVRILTVLTIGLISANCAPKFTGLAPAVTIPQLNSDHSVMADNTRLAVAHWVPNNGAEAEAVVIALHGFNDYHNAFSLMGPYFADNNVITYAYDQRGFGESGTPGQWPGEVALVDDLRSFTHLVSKQHPDLPLFLLGESMGAAVVLLGAAGRQADKEVCGAILAAPAVWGWSNLNFAYAFVLGITARIAPGWKLTGGGLDILPSDNIEMLREMSRDPLIIKGTRTDAIYGLVDLMDNALKAASAIHIPTLLLYGEKDQVIPEKPLKKLQKNLHENAENILYPDGYHLLLRDLNRRVVWQDILTFINKNHACI